MRAPIRLEIAICLESFRRGAKRFAKDMVCSMGRSWSVSCSVFLYLPFGAVHDDAAVGIFVTQDVYFSERKYGTGAIFISPALMTRPTNDGSYFSSAFGS